MNQPEKTIRLPAILENLEKFVEFALSCARQWKIDEKKIPGIHLVTDEACVNIINYAYPAGREGELELTCSLAEKKFLLSIRDWGKEFDPTTTPPPDLELDLEHRPIGGLGVFLIKKYSDEFHYARENGANKLRIGIKL